MAEREIRLSVVLPVYNVQKHLDQCMESLVRQTLTGVEYICIDDGSTDRSLRILRDYERYDARFRVMSQANAGVAVARNRGIAEARGKYVAFMDPDDLYPERTTLEKLWDAAETHGVAIAGGSWSEQHPTWVRTSFEGVYDQYTFQRDELLTYADYQFDYGFHRFIYSLDLLRAHDIGFPELIRFQDPPFFVRAMVAAGEFYALAEPTYRYRWGHQKLDWNHRRTMAVLTGLQDVLGTAAHHSLDDLQALAWWRLTTEYRSRFTDRMLLGDATILETLIECLKWAPSEEAAAEISAMIAEGHPSVTEARAG